MRYTNPIIQADYSDPDVIRVKDDFFMVASSFNHVPGIPVLHSKNLVNWKLINYVFDRIPFERFDRVCHGDGAWAPSIRFHDGWYYCLIPFPDEGIYVSKTRDPFGTWSPLWPLIEGKGLEDPCPIWTNGKCYVVIGFAKSRAGFNSCLGLYEVKPDLSGSISPTYQIIYDGHDQNPTIEGPKFNERNGYYYILAPAGSVKGGWQTALRSKNIEGPYESKIVLFQGDSLVNGPHQGALVDLDDEDHWAFIHFQDMRAYGRIVHLQPVLWYNDWPLMGQVSDPLLCGTPVSESDYPVAVLSNDAIPSYDLFQDRLSLVWQTPANPKPDWWKVDNGLYLSCVQTDEMLPLHLVPQSLLQKVMYLNFTVETSVLCDFSTGDETGLVMMGQQYAYLALHQEEDGCYVELREGSFQQPETVLERIFYPSNQITWRLKARNKDFYTLEYQLGFNDHYFKKRFIATAGRWIGAKVGLYARSKNQSSGVACYQYFKVKKVEKNLKMKE